MVCCQIFFTYIADPSITNNKTKSKYIVCFFKRFENSAIKTRTHNYTSSSYSQDNIDFVRASVVQYPLVVVYGEFSYERPVIFRKCRVIFFEH